MHISIKNRNIHNVPKVVILFELNLCMGGFQQKASYFRRLKQIEALFYYILTTHVCIEMHVFIYYSNFNTDIKFLNLTSQNILNQEESFK